MKIIDKYKYHFLAFLIPFLILTIYIYIKGMFSYNFYVSDLRYQYVYLFDYLKSMFDGNNSIFYFFGRGIGGSMYGTFFYYLSSPLNLLFLLSNEDNIHIFIIILILIKIGLCGLTMYMYLSKSNKNDNLMNLILSLCYALMSFNITYCFNIMWLDTIYLAPLILLGLDKIIKNQKSIIYILFLFMSIVSNYYTSYMLCIFLCVYFLFRLFTQYNYKKNKQKVKKIVTKFIISSLLAGFLASFLIIPVLGELKNVFRGENIFEYNLALNPFNAILKFSITETDYLYHYKFYPYIFCGFFPLVILINYFMNVKDKNKKNIIYVFVFFSLSVMIPTLVKIWHGFSLPFLFVHRWVFLFSLFMIVISGEKYTKIKKLPLKKIVYISLAYIGIIIMSYLFSTDEELKLYLIFINFVFILFTILTVNEIKKTNRLFYKTLLLLITASSIFLQLHLSFESNYFLKPENNYDNHFYKDRVKFRNQFANLEKNYYRIGGDFIYTWNETFGLINGRNQFFLSSTLKNIMNFYKYSGYDILMNNCNDNENQTILHPLLGIKYWYGKSNDNNYKLFKNNKIKVYKNDKSLNIGYMINYKKQKINYDNPFEYQNSFFKTIYGKEIFKKYTSDIKTDSDIYLYSKVIDCDEEQYLVIQTTERNEPYYYCTEQGITKFENNSITDLKTENVSINYEDILYYYVDEDAFNEMMNNLSKEQIDITKIEKNKMEFNIKSKKNDTLLLTIPYDKGWNIYVDGKKVNYFEIFDTFIGIKMKKGNHKIKMVYYPKYLELGIMMSIIDAIVLFIYMKKK